MKNAAPLWSALAMALGFSGGLATAGGGEDAPVLYDGGELRWALHYGQRGDARLAVSAGPSVENFPRYAGSALVDLPVELRAELVALSPSPGFSVIYINATRAAVRLAGVSKQVEGAPAKTRAWIGTELPRLCAENAGLCSPAEVKIDAS